MCVFNVLIDKRINSMFLGNDGWTLLFRDVNGHYYRFDTENDCCNTVWFNHISGVTSLGSGDSFDLLRGAKVLKVEEKGWNDNREDEDGFEVVQEGFWTILTDRGYIDLEVRNSHNGYYGGSVVHIENVALDAIEDLKQLTEDF